MIKSADINISVPKNEWGEANPRVIETLLKYVASHINRELYPPFTEEINVEKSDAYHPYACFQNDRNQPHTIKLATGNFYWCQYAYQFTQMFCHVLSGHNKLRGCKNGWFHQALCELSSIFTLRRMGERWHTEPPFPNWDEYAKNFRIYEEGVRIGNKKHFCQEYQIKNTIVPIDWLSNYEEEMRTTSVGENTNGDRHEKYRAIYGLIAYTLLPIFEKYPDGWNAVRYLPKSDSYIKQYLYEWLRLARGSEQFISHCIECLEATITPFEPSRENHFTKTNQYRTRENEKNKNKEKSKEGNQEQSFSHKIEHSSEIEAALSAIKNNDKFLQLYKSLCRVSLEQDPILAYVGAWSFFDSLATAMGRRKGSFPDFFESKINEWWKKDRGRISDFTETLKDIGEEYESLAEMPSMTFTKTLKKISSRGNRCKHSDTYYQYNAMQLIIYFRTLEKFIIRCFGELLKEGENVSLPRETDR